MSEDVAPNLRGKRIVKIDLPSIFNDSKNSEEVPARLDAAFKQIEASGGKTITVRRRHLRLCQRQRRVWRRCCQSDSAIGGRWESADYQRVNRRRIQ